MPSVEIELPLFANEIIRKSRVVDKVFCTCKIAQIQITSAFDTNEIL